MAMEPLTPPSQCHLHVASLMGHHKSRRKAILMVEGTASQGVTHASDRRVPCRGERKKEREVTGSLGGTCWGLSPAQSLQGHPDLVSAGIL